MDIQAYEKAKLLLQKYKQDKLLKTLEINENKEALVKQILSIDFEQLQQLYEQTQNISEMKDEEIENIAYVDGNQLNEEEKKNYQNIGEKIIKQGKYAVVTMAGGQGTRLRT